MHFDLSRYFFGGLLAKTNIKNETDKYNIV